MALSTSRQCLKSSRLDKIDGVEAATISVAAFFVPIGGAAKPFSLVPFRAAAGLM
jgi:hypothetical protein